MIKKKLALFGLAGLLSLSSCIVKIKKFDFDESQEVNCENDFSDFERIVDSTFKLRVRTTYGIYRDEYKFTETVYGSAFVIGSEINITYVATSAGLLPKQQKIYRKKINETEFKEFDRIEKVELNLVTSNSGDETQNPFLRYFAVNYDNGTAILIGVDINKEKFPNYSSFIQDSLLKSEQEVFVVDNSSFDYITLGRKKRQFSIEGVVENGFGLSNQDLEIGMVGGPVFVMHHGNALIAGVITKNGKNYIVNTSLLKIIGESRLSYLVKRHAKCNNNH